MHAALQSARNQSSLETPLKAEELLSAHFNLAVLEDQTIKHTNPDAEKSPDNTQNAEPSTSAPDDQTYVKIPAGYESDDSWDNLSHNHDHAHMHNIVPLLTLRPWRNSSRRGPEQQQF